MHLIQKRPFLAPGEIDEIKSCPLLVRVDYKHGNRLIKYKLY